MRDIKFRVWIDNKMFYINDELYISFFNAKNAVDWAIYNRFDEGCFYKHDSSYPEMYKNNYLMQYTGLKDKNGKEIYNGDLINSYQNDYMPTEVFWDNDCCQWATQNYHSTLNLSDSMDKNTEIIGNIHQDQELLK